MSAGGDSLYIKRPKSGTTSEKGTNASVLCSIHTLSLERMCLLSPQGRELTYGPAPVCLTHQNRSFLTTPTTTIIT